MNQGWRKILKEWLDSLSDPSPREKPKWGCIHCSYDPDGCLNCFNGGGSGIGIGD